MPLRIIIVIIFLSLTVAVAKLSSSLCKNKSQYGQHTFNKMENVGAMLVRLFLRLTLIGVGMIPGSIQVKGKNDMSCPIVVFNHSGIAECFAIPAVLRSCFLFQVDQGQPGFVLACGEASKSIPVNRKEVNSRADCKASIKQKADNHALIDWAPGAFSPLHKVQLCSIKQPLDCVTNLSGNSSAWGEGQFILGMCACWIDIQFDQGPALEPLKDENEIQFMNRAHSAMIDLGSFKYQEGCKYFDGNDYRSYLGFIGRKSKKTLKHNTYLLEWCEQRRNKPRNRKKSSQDFDTEYDKETNSVEGVEKLIEHRSQRKSMRDLNVEKQAEVMQENQLADNLMTPSDKLQKDFPITSQSIQLDSKAKRRDTSQIMQNI